MSALPSVLDIVRPAINPLARTMEGISAVQQARGAANPAASSALAAAFNSAKELGDPEVIGRGEAGEPGPAPAPAPAALRLGARERQAAASRGRSRSRSSSRGRSHRASRSRSRSRRRPRHSSRRSRSRSQGRDRKRARRSSRSRDPPSSAQPTDDLKARIAALLGQNR